MSKNPARTPGRLNREWGSKGRKDEDRNRNLNNAARVADISERLDSMSEEEYGTFFDWDS